MNEPGQPGGLALQPAAPPDLGVAVAALRARGAERLDPVRFQFIEALARRAAQHSGAAREVMDGKLAQALQDCGDRLAQAVRVGNPAADDLSNPGAGAGVDADPDADSGAAQAPRSPLADLLRHIALQSPAEADGRPTPAGADLSTAPAELRTLRMFRSTWSKLRVDQQLAESLAKLPENAGPLNSNLLVLRSLKLMRDTSPAYLKCFMSYVDALLWLDQASFAAAPAKKIALGSEGVQKRKPARRKTS